jgi:hypothetical protein
LLVISTKAKPLGCPVSRSVTRLTGGCIGERALFGNVQPEKTLNLYYHLSSDGKEARGPWNEAPTFECIADPVQTWFFWMSSRRSAASSSIGLLS